MEITADSAYLYLFRPTAAKVRGSRALNQQDLKIELSPEARRLGISVVAKAIHIQVTRDYDLHPYVSQARSRLTLSKDELKNHEVARALRDFYWKIGIDPTKQRPSSEALARRLISTASLPKINNVVDACNLVSAETLIPIGLYDIERIEGRLVLRAAQPGESFTDINGETKTLGEGEIVLSDDVGPLHIFPHRDADRTKITLKTRDVLIVACGVPGISEASLESAAERVGVLAKELAASKTG